ncbi:arylamine N-acetyltransferase 1 [Polyplosphaeria fusca]|uniref:Arylamine N-acetyltransferase 1 n=1 Tax=Polyplosphaeria fusca TaxID=682080 RepID=A0A9P4QY94_9PLEO|nr:arylamine N-acetyltransferase 1 [Polyplosphaeria fusca]
MASNERPTFSRDQITQYFERLKLPGDRRIYAVAHLEPQDALDYLTVLQKHHLVEVPFENLALHYSHHRQISIHAQELFRKIISDNNGRGGYCMENNTLFGTLLRSLGFTLFSAGARVFDNGQFTGWSHMVNIVRVGDYKYHVDVGFGSNGPIVPMKLVKDGHVQQNIHPAAARLRWANIPVNTDPDQRLWLYEHRLDEKSDFQTIYCFTELEFLPSDYNLMNYFTSTSPRTFFTQTVVVEKKVLGGDRNDELVGSLTLFNRDLKWRTHGQKEREIHFESEDDRFKALEEHFGIQFGEFERASIRGLTSEVKAKS